MRWLPNIISFHAMDKLSGYDDDDGNEIKPNLYLKPQFWMSCKKNDDPMTKYENQNLSALLIKLSAKNFI